ncbi:MAG TPA: hypothetical protein P5181_07185 [Dermatophilaceae bacterium]|nr:hypothetical protein [Dermatophilaceae bacterium]
MTATTARDLLNHAHTLTDDLTRSHEQVTRTHWDTFEHTLHRALHTVIRPWALPTRGREPRALHAIINEYPPLPRRPEARMHSPREAAALLGVSITTVMHRIHTSQLPATRRTDGRFHIDHHLLDTGAPHPTPAAAGAPHPLARLCVTLGVFTDLMHLTPTRQRPDLGETRTAANELLHITRQVARHTLTYGPYDLAQRAALVGQHADTHLTHTAARATGPVALAIIRAVAPDRTSRDLNDRLETAVHDWSAAAHEATSISAPSVDVLRNIANHGAHLLAVTHHLSHTANTPGKPALAPAPHPGQSLSDTINALRQAETAWRATTTLTRPAAAYVHAARALFTALVDTRRAHDHADPGLDRARAVADLNAGSGAVADLLTTTATLPHRLAGAGALYGPARVLTPGIDRLTDRTRGRHTALHPGEAADIVRAWQHAADQLRHTLGPTTDRSPSRSADTAAYALGRTPA